MVDNSFLLIGITCVVVAIIGGGLHVFGKKIPLLDSTMRQTLLGLFGLVIIIPIVNPGGLTRFKCDRYARVAVDQHKKNLKLGCSLTGNRWHDNFDSHYNWCLDYSSDIPKHEMDARKSVLDNCANPNQSN